MPVRTTPSKVPAPPETVTPSGQRPAAADHVDDDQYDADEKQDPGDLAGDGGDPEQSQRTGNESDDEKHQRVVQHWRSPPPSSECNGNAVGTAGQLLETIESCERNGNGDVELRVVLRHLVGTVFTPELFDDVTDRGGIRDIVEKFRRKYGADEVAKYYSKYDVAVAV